MKYSLLGALVAAALIAGCASQQSETSAPPGISYRVSTGDMRNADERASKYCQQYGRRAQLQGVNHDNGDNIAVYNCS
jgi:hypothetical protein